MGLVELFFVAVGLSMDAFAVAICKGLGMKRLDAGKACLIALFFGGFQALMPAIGWLLGSQFARIVEPIDHWIAFGLLACIGAKMVGDALHADDGDEGGSGGKPGPKEAENASAAARHGDGSEAGSGEANSGAGSPDVPLDMRELVLLAIATSIDALAVGVTFAFLQMDIVFPVLFIGVTTFALSLAGVAIGHQFGSRWERPSTIAGGIVLVLIGCKILLEHLGIIAL